MAISIFFGRNLPDESIEQNYALVQKLKDMFTKKFGSINCRELTGCDLGTETGQDYFKKNNLSDKCKKMTGETAAMTISLIEEEVNLA